MRILILEDMASDAELIEHELQVAGFRFISRRVDTGESFFRALQEFRPDLILADFSLPAFDGRSALAIARREMPDTPFIFVSGAMGEELAIELLKEGATDYIIKDHLSRLPPAVERAFREIEERRERLAAEKKLRDSEERYRALVQSTDDSIYMLDREGRFLFVNDRYLYRLGHELEDVLGHYYGEFHSEEQNRIAMERLREVFTIGHSLQYENRGPGGDRYFLRTLSPVRNEAGEVISVTVISKDITERRQAEDALIKAHNELEERVRERTAELASSNEKLRDEIEERRRAQEELLRANEKLFESISELEQRNHEIEILSEMGSLLQACVHPSEAYGVIAISVQRLFARDSGAVFLRSPELNLLESITTWGEDYSQEHVFDPKECWALRLGRVYFGDSTSANMVCPHLSGSRPAAYLDVPVMAQGETIGLLSVIFDRDWKMQPEETRNRMRRHKEQLSMTFAEHIGLALANFKLRETLYIQSMHDPLTGLFNRRYFGDMLDRELHRMARKNHPLGVIMIDIDHFKEVNDQYGHDAGDVYLREFSSVLQRHIREEDFVCRYGGEEFVIVLPETPLSISCQRAEHLREEVQNMNIAYEGHSIGGVTLSIGVAGFPEHGTTVEQLLRCADEALYRAKTEGRDRVVVCKGE